MGFFSSIKSGVEFDKFSRETIMPAINAGIQHQQTGGGSAELYELFMFIWKRVLSDHGKNVLSDSGSDMVKYFAVIGIKDGTFCLRCALAEILLPSFQETSEREKYGEIMSKAFEWERSDDGRAMEKIFREFFPRSYAAFIREQGHVPFDPKIRQAVESGDPIAMARALRR